MLGSDPFEVALWVLTSAAIVFLVFCTIVLARAMGVLSRVCRVLDEMRDELRLTGGKVREAAERHGRAPSAQAARPRSRPVTGPTPDGDGRKPATPAAEPAPRTGEESESRGA